MFKDDTEESEDPFSHVAVTKTIRVCLNMGSKYEMQPTNPNVHTLSIVQMSEHIETQSCNAPLWNKSLFQRVLYIRNHLSLLIQTLFNRLACTVLQCRKEWSMKTVEFWVGNVVCRGATSSEHTLNPQPPEWNGSPCYAFGEKSIGKPWYSPLSVFREHKTGMNTSMPW